MLKIQEIREPESCWSKCDLYERVFVLLARDNAAPETIRFWANERIRIGNNVREDDQIQQAFACADQMDKERAELRDKLRDSK